MDNFTKNHVNEISEGTKKNTVSRILMALVIGAVLIPCMVLGGYYWLAFIVFLLVVTTHELCKAPQTIEKRFKPLIYVFSYIMMFTLVFWLFFKDTMFSIHDYIDKFGSLEGYKFVLETSFPYLSLSVSCFACNVAFFFFLVVIDKSFTISDAFYFITMLFVCALAFQSLLFLRYAPFRAGLKVNVDIGLPEFRYFESFLLIAYILIISMINDAGGYFFGILFGKHKLTRISPKKTWEGFFGGIFTSFVISFGFAILCSYFGFPLLRGVLDFEHWYNILILSLINPFIAVLGDLLFSSIKRYFGIKDFGFILRSHGGILDRLDSIIAVSISTSILVMIMINSYNFFI